MPRILESVVDRLLSQARKIHIGQLVRERFGVDCKRVRPSLNDSIEFLLHDALTNDSIMSHHGQYFLLFRSNNPTIALSEE